MNNFFELLEDSCVDVILVNGKKYLFTNARIDRSTVPECLHCYDVRDDNDGIFHEIKPHIVVNHWGTIVGAELPLNSEGSYIPNEEDGDFIDVFTMEDLIPDRCQIGFINEGREDWTEFDTSDTDELKELWRDFAKENNFPPCLITKAIFSLRDSDVIYEREKEEGWEEFFDSMDNCVWDGKEELS